MDLKSPKKQRHEGQGPAAIQPGAGSPGANFAPHTGWLPHPSASPPSQQPQEAGGSNEATLATPASQRRPAGEPAVTDAAKAFRELRVRPALSGVEGGARAGSPSRPPLGAPERPPSPKKRKATFSIDKEFILKDDKVKRNTDTQGDISQARGQLGQLLFEFSQIELNRDLLEAMKRTESKTGRSGGSRAPAPGRLNRAAFEAAVADAAELLQVQLSMLEAHSEDAALRSAILRTYAVQAIAAYADEESEEDEEAAAEGAPHEGSPAGGSSDEKNNDSNSRLRGGSSSLEGPQPAASGEAGSQLSHDGGAGQAGAACHPAGGRLALAVPRQRPAAAPDAARRGGGSAPTSPQRPQAAGSAAQQASSSYLPDAPPDSALEDTASAALREECQAAAAAEQQPRQRQRRAEQGGTGGAAAGDDGAVQRRMRALSLEAEGSAQLQGASSGGKEGEGPRDMLRSPAPVTSRRTVQPEPPLGGCAQGAGAADAPDDAPQAGVAQPGAAQQQQQQQQQGARRSLPSAGGRSAQQHRRPHPHAQQQQQQQQQDQGSEGESGGGASSAVAEPPKRQRRSGDLPPLHEHAAHVVGGGPGKRRASNPSATEAAAAAQRALILGSVPQQRSPDQQQQRQQSPELPAAGPAQGAGAGSPGGDAAPAREPAAEATLGAGVARGDAPSGSSVWGSTLVCADLTLTDVASQYWPFLRSAMRGQAVQLQEGDRELVAALVRVLGDTIADAYRAAAGGGRRPAAEVKSLAAATAFDDMFRAAAAASSSAASQG